MFYLLEGSMRIKCGDLDAVASAGSTIYLPRGVPHAFRVEGMLPARWFNVQSPHGDFMLRAAGADAGVPGPAATDADAIELIGPPPF